MKFKGIIWRLIASPFFFIVLTGFALWYLIKAIFKYIIYGKKMNLKNKTNV